LSQRCEICGIQEPRYVCSRCGKRVCARDFRLQLWLCTSCEPVPYAETQAPASALPIGFSWIFFASFAMILLGMILMMISSLTQAKGITSGGAVILIGPIPIILGSGPESTWLILMAVIITMIALAAFLLSRRKM